MQNENYYKNELEIIINDFIEMEKADDSNFDLGHISPETAKNMAEAAFLVLKQNHDLNKYLQSEDLLD